jgi:hypothetical protein
VSSTQVPPFKTVTIAGKTKSPYNRVSLFEKGSSKTPFKTETIAESDKAYRIVVNIPKDMLKKDDYFYTDMRFWEDKNDNSIKDSGESISKCHFIIWVPSSEAVYLKIYKGKRYKFRKPSIEYNYK